MENVFSRRPVPVFLLIKNCVLEFIGFQVRAAHNTRKFTLSRTPRVFQFERIRSFPSARTVYIHVYYDVRKTTGFSGLTFRGKD